MSLFVQSTAKGDINRQDKSIILHFHLDQLFDEEDAEEDTEDRNIEEREKHFDYEEVGMPNEPLVRTRKGLRGLGESVGNLWDDIRDRFTSFFDISYLNYDDK